MKQMGKKLSKSIFIRSLCDFCARLVTDYERIIILPLEVVITRFTSAQGFFFVIFVSFSLKKLVLWWRFYFHFSSCLSLCSRFAGFSSFPFYFPGQSGKTSEAENSGRNDESEAEERSLAGTKSWIYLSVPNPSDRFLLSGFVYSDGLNRIHDGG